MQEMTQRREGTATQAGGDDLLRPLTTLELGYLHTTLKGYQVPIMSSGVIKRTPRKHNLPQNQESLRAGRAFF